MTEKDEALGQHRDRPRQIWLAGWLIILLSAGAAALPLIDARQGATIIAGMLVLAGTAEIIAARPRRQTRILAAGAGVLTVIAGILFFTDSATRFLPMLFIIAGWLFLRSIVLGVAARREFGSVRLWTGLSAFADFFLAVLLAIGISISVLVVTIFGPTEQLIANFAWVLAISFVVTGCMLLEVAKCARTEEV